MSDLTCKFNDLGYDLLDLDSLAYLTGSHETNQLCADIPAMGGIVGGSPSQTGTDIYVACRDIRVMGDIAGSNPSQTGTDIYVACRDQGVIP